MTLSKTNKNKNKNKNENTEFKEVKETANKNAEKHQTIFSATHKLVDVNKNEHKKGFEITKITLDEPGKRVAVRKSGVSDEATRISNDGW